LAMEFLKARCLDRLNRKQEAVDAYRKIATVDKGLWGKSAKAELDHKEFKDNKDKTESKIQ